jgi:hypothetical protein
MIGRKFTSEEVVRPRQAGNPTLPEGPSSRGFCRNSGRASATRANPREELVSKSEGFRQSFRPRATREASDRPEDTPTLRTSPLNLSLRIRKWTALGRLKLTALLCLSPVADLGLYRGGEAVLPAKNERVWSRCMAGRPRVWPGGHFSPPTDSKFPREASTCPRRSVTAKFRWNPRNHWPAGPLDGRAATFPPTDTGVASPCLHVSYSRRCAQVLVRSEDRLAGRTLTWPAGPHCGVTDLGSVPLWPAGPHPGRAAVLCPRRSQVRSVQPDTSSKIRWYEVLACLRK